VDQVLAAVDGDALVGLTQRLLQIDSTNPPGKELAVAEALLQQAREWGLEAELQAVDDQRANVIVRLRGAQSGPSLLYCGHLDTVPIGESVWDADPFGGELRDGRLFGRGASDMKSGVAAMLAGMAALATAKVTLPGDVLLAGVVGEEVDCVGSRHFLAEAGMRGVGWLIISEPTNLDLVIVHKGALRVEITTHGRSAHGAMPALGVNAILHMMELSHRLCKLELPHTTHALLSPPTLSINTIAGGFRTNVVPDVCRITVDIRTVPEQDHPSILALLEGVIRELEIALPEFRASVSVIDAAPPVATAETDPLVAVVLRTAARVLGTRPTIRGVNYFSDASVLQPPTGVPTVLFGPGDERLMHQINEAVGVDALVKASQVFALLPLELHADLGFVTSAPTAEHA
jgi:succinyl-diaminopimelate desuccinylase